MKRAALLLLAAGCASARPAAKALVELPVAAPGVRLDLRYATADNFTKTAVYPAARCLLRPEAAAALSRVQAGLAAQGLGLKLWDCYRPLSVQKKFWALVPDPRYVADPKKGSRHNRGAALDLTLVDSDGRELEMPTGFDDFSERAKRGAPGATGAGAANAVRLEAAMVKEGFTGLPTEWWHFDFQGWERFPVLDEPLTP